MRCCITNRCDHIRLTIVVIKKIQVLVRSFSYLRRRPISPSVHVIALLTMVARSTRLKRGRSNYGQKGFVEYARGGRSVGFVSAWVVPIILKVYRRYNRRMRSLTTSSLTFDDEILNAEPRLLFPSSLEEDIIRDQTCIRFPTATRPRNTRTTSKWLASRGTKDQGVFRIRLTESLQAGIVALVEQSPPVECNKS